MRDGHVNKCKECNKSDVRVNRLKNIDRYREYDRIRGNRQGYEYIKKYRSDNPEKYSAHKAVSNALRDGKLTQMNCEVCGREDAHAHHDDYSKPLEVRWLCPPHHKQHHIRLEC